MKIAVYCGSGFGNDGAYETAARRLGRWIGSQGHTLIYGGGEAGLMGAVAQEAHQLGSRVIGVLPGNVPFICERPQPYCTEVLTMPHMAARKERMLELADAFIALPGGIGTLDEISEAVTLTKIGVFRKPAVLFNTDGFYEPFRAMMTGMEQAAFLAPGDLQHVLYSDDVNEIGAFLAPYAPKE